MASHSDSQCYEVETKIQYYEMLHEAAKKKPLQILKKRLWVKMMIQRILSAKEFVKRDGDAKKLPPCLKEALCNYDVVNDNSEQRLALRPKKPNDTAKVIVPLEESFEVVLKAHLDTRHGGCREMNRYLFDSNQIVAMICTPILISACHKCLLSTVEEEVVEKTSMKEIYSTLAFVNIIDMTLQPDKFDHLLVYRDVKTKFVQLRPITATNMIEEITMEMVKMFCDFPPPNCIVTIEELKEVFENVLARLNTIFSPKLSLETCDAKEYTVTDEVVSRLTGWIKYSANEWSVGCYFVQWDMNKSRSYDGSPYENFFRVGRFTNMLPYGGETREQPEAVNVDCKRRRNMDNLTYYGIDKSACSKDKSTGSKFKSTGSKVKSTGSKDKSTGRKAKLTGSKYKSTESKDKSTGSKDKSTGSKDKLSDDKWKSTDLRVKSKYGKGKTAEYKDKTTVSNNKLTVGKDSLTVHDVELQTNENTNISTQTISFKEESLEQFVIETVNTEQGSEMETELQRENETHMHICCLCGEEVATQVHFCSECKKSLHMYCGVRRKATNGVFENVCFLCLKP